MTPFFCRLAAGAVSVSLVFLASGLRGKGSPRATLASAIARDRTTGCDGPYADRRLARALRSSESACESAERERERRRAHARYSRTDAGSGGNTQNHRGGEAGGKVGVQTSSRRPIIQSVAAALFKLKATWQGRGKGGAIRLLTPTE